MTAGKGRDPQGATHITVLQDHEERVAGIPLLPQGPTMGRVEGEVCLLTDSPYRILRVSTIMIIYTSTIAESLSGACCGITGVDNASGLTLTQPLTLKMVATVHIKTMNNIIYN